MKDISGGCIVCSLVDIRAGQEKVMKLLPQIVFLFNILELCLSKEISIFGQYEHFYHFLAVFE